MALLPYTLVLRVVGIDSGGLVRPFPPPVDVMELAPSVGGTLNVPFLQVCHVGSKFYVCFVAPVDPDLVLRWVTIWEASKRHVTGGGACGALSGVQEVAPASGNPE